MNELRSPKQSNELVQFPVQDSSKTSVTQGLADMAALARQAFDEKRRKESLALARAILKIDPDSKEAKVIEIWIRLDLNQNLEIGRKLARDANLKNTPSLYEQAETMARAVLDVDPDHEEAAAFLSEVSKGNSYSPVPPIVSRGTRPAESLQSMEERFRAEGQYSRLTGIPDRFRSKSAVVLFALAVIVVAWLVIRQQGRAITGSEGVTPASMGILDIVVDDGVQVLVNDEDQGLPPIKPLTVAPGVYRLKYKVNGEEIASEEVTVAAGSTAHNSTRQPASRLMLIVAPTSGVQLSVDNESIGAVPPYLDVKPGEHRLTFTAPGQESATRVVSVKPGGRQLITVLLRPSLDQSSSGGGVPVNKTGHARTGRTPPLPSNSVPSPPPSAAAPVAAQAASTETGTLAVNSMLPIDIYSGGTYLGSTPTTLTLPPGTHDFNFRYGNLQKSGTYAIRGGYNTTATITFDVTLDVNARPWAEVFVDGNPARPLGQTPLASVSVPIGGTLVFRNPSFPEKKYRVMATDTAIHVVFP